MAILRRLWAGLAAGAVLLMAVPSVGAQAIVRGTLYDSLFTNAPLAGAMVFVHGTLVTTVTDRRGRFVLRGVPPGRHVVSFTHSLLDSLEIGAPAVFADVGEHGTVVLPLAIPSPNGVSLRFCERPAEPSTAVVLGVVTSAETGAPLPDAEASVRWFEIELNGLAVRQHEREASARSREDGTFLLCGVPNDIVLALQVSHRGQTTGALHLSLGGAGIARRDAVVSESDTAARQLAAMTGEDTLAAEPPPGTGLLRVVVRNEQRRPVRGAIVGVRGTTRSAVTDQAGRAIISGLPAGSQTLAVRAIGLSPAIQVVALTPHREVAVAVTLDRFAFLLPEVAVVGQRSEQLDQQIARRLRAGFGRYFDEAALRDAASGGLSFWLRIPGVYLNADGGHDATPLMRSGSGTGRCRPQVWMDGMRMFQMDGWELRGLLAGARRMEVYTSALNTPPEFTSVSRDPCGAIVIWSR